MSSFQRMNDRMWSRCEDIRPVLELARIVKWARSIKYYVPVFHKNQPNKPTTLFFESSEKMSAMIYKLITSGLQPDCSILVDKHLNFDIRYELERNIVTRKKYVFHTQQIHPSVGRCVRGKCSELLCQIPEEEFKTSAKDWDNPNDEVWDPVIGKRVRIDEKGVVSFHDQDGDQTRLDLNWRRLRNMAMPIIDEQLSKVALSGIWKDKPVRVDLGTLMLDNNVVRFDEASYREMTKNNKQDMDHCVLAWNKKINSIRLKRKEEQEVDIRNVKCRKLTTNMLTHLDFWDDKKENEEGTSDKNDELTPEVAESFAIASAVNESEGVRECPHCCEEPCIWVANKALMKLHDKNEHAHLLVDDVPPHNIRRKLLYRQMFLIMNGGGSGAVVRVELPMCVTDGVQVMFPSPTFMGFLIR